MKPSDLGVSIDDWHVLQRASPSLLIVGPDAEASRLLDALLPTLQPPVIWCSSRPFALPTDRVGTLVLQHAADLSLAAQEALLQWLKADAHPSLRIITTTPVSLLPRVDQGLFLDNLYYRLNVMCLFVGV